MSARPIVVIKVGTSSLVDTASGRVQVVSLARVAEASSHLIARGYAVIVVSSGAVGLGCVRLGLRERPTSIAGKQAAAAVGQLKLLSLYDDVFSVLGLAVAQVLLTYDNFGDRTQYDNARAAFSELLRLGAVPIVNENDTVAVQELKVGDNDTLSALVAAMVGARWLLLLTDVDALFDANPRDIPCAVAIRSVAPSQIQTLRRQMAQGARVLRPSGDGAGDEGETASLASVGAGVVTGAGMGVQKDRSPSRKSGARGGQSSANGGSSGGGGGGGNGGGGGGAGTAFGTGGMITKLKAAQLATAAGTTVVIMNTGSIERLEDALVAVAGGVEPPVTAFAERCLGTTFFPSPSPVTRGRKRWILSLAPDGVIALDAGAIAAVSAHKSLFASGVVRVSSNFDAHDCVSLVDAATGHEVARALVNYCAADCARLLGRSSAERADILGLDSGPEALADRDNVVLLVGE